MKIVPLAEIEKEEGWHPKFYYIRPLADRHGRDGFERRCDLCGKRSHWHSVIGRIYISSDGLLFSTRDENHIKTWRPRTLLKSETGQLGEGFHWICRYRKKCREVQWANIRNLT